MTQPTGSWLIDVSKPRSTQDPKLDSFVGGRPKLPRGVEFPLCVNCRALMTFFLQVAFPVGQPWAGESLAIFACTACRDEKQSTPFVDQELIPSMTNSTLGQGDDVPDGALDLVQRWFRFFVFDTGEAVLRDDYNARVVHRPIVLKPQLDAKSTKRSKVGGAPRWLQIDYTPGNYLGEPLEFLMQWKHDFKFARVAGSPDPFNPYADMMPDFAAGIDHYNLFLNVQLYFYGNRARGRPHVYMIPEVP